MTVYYSLYIDGLVIGIVVSLYLIARLWTIRKTPGAGYLIWAIFCVVIWSFAYIFEISLKDYVLKNVWSVIEYLGIPFLPLAIFSFVLAYSGRGRWLTGSRFVLLALPPTATFLLAATNHWHQWLWSRISMPTGSPIGPLTLEHGPWYSLNIAYSYALILMATFFLAQIATRDHNLYRAQARIMLIGMILPWVVNAIYVFHLSSPSSVDWTPFVFTLTVIALEIGFVRYGLMDILPVAQSTMFNAMQDGVIVADLKGRVVEINPSAQQIFRSQGDSLIGKDVSQILPAWIEWNTDPKAVLETSHEITLGEGSTPCSYNLRITPIQDRRGQITGRLVTLNDITEEKQAEAQLRQAHDEAVEANRLKTQLLASISHDLRTPLGAIMGYADMIQSGAVGKANLKQQQAAAEILDSANQVLVFVNNLISQAQIETGRVVLKIDSFEPAELIKAVRSTISYVVQKKRLALETEIDPNLPSQINGDAYWLKQIVLNLAINAVKFTDNGLVKIRLFMPDRGHWAIRVTDTGIGIPKEAQGTIFEAFHQIESLPTRRRSGSGLGLSIVHQLVTLMGGQIELLSEVGQGSMFTVILPLSFH